jgi:hypothetical protein
MTRQQQLKNMSLNVKLLWTDAKCDLRWPGFCGGRQETIDQTIPGSRFGSKGPKSNRVCFWVKSETQGAKEASQRRILEVAKAKRGKIWKNAFSKPDPGSFVCWLAKEGAGWENRNSGFFQHNNGDDLGVIVEKAQGMKRIKGERAALQKR